MTQKKPLVIGQGAAAQIQSGDTLDPAYLGTGTRDGARFLRDDGVWSTPAGGSSGSGIVHESVSASFPGQTTVPYIGTIRRYFSSGREFYTISAGVSETSAGNITVTVYKNTTTSVASITITAGQTFAAGAGTWSVTSGDYITINVTGSNCQDLYVCIEGAGPESFTTEPTSQTITYDGNQVSSIYEVMPAGDRTTSYSYNTDGTVDTETIVRFGVTRTITYSYSGGKCTGYTATVV